jgi:hypothetical protein
MDISEFDCLTKKEIIDAVGGRSKFPNRSWASLACVRSQLGALAQEDLDALRTAAQQKKASSGISSDFSNEISSLCVHLTREEILGLLPAILVPEEVRQSKHTLVTHIVQLSLDAVHLQALRLAAGRKVLSGLPAPSVALNVAPGTSAATSMSSTLVPDPPTTSAHLDSLLSQKVRRPRSAAELHSRCTQDIPPDPLDPASCFLQVPTVSEIASLQRAFVDATCNAALEEAVCAVCARIAGVVKEQMQIVPVGSIPHGHRLHPRATHPAHELTNSMLLESRGTLDVDGRPHTRICATCLSSLKTERQDELPPALSLVNSMWIGEVPFDLQILTFPEAILISQVYPRMFVVKLFPRDRNARYSPDMLQSGLRGNVTSYELNTKDIVSMLEGKLMPRPVDVLASVLSVTYVARGKLPKNWIHSTFRVRRSVVFRALAWCQRNNRFYHDISIQPERLAALPEDDVPEVILRTMRQEDDADVLDAESEGYVPQEEVPVQG